MAIPLYECHLYDCAIVFKQQVSACCYCTIKYQPFKLNIRHWLICVFVGLQTEIQEYYRLAVGAS